MLVAENAKAAVASAKAENTAVLNKLWLLELAKTGATAEAGEYLAEATEQLPELRLLHNLLSTT